MPVIKHQQANASPEISLAEIHILDDRDLGTGTFTTTFRPGTLPPTKVMTSLMLNAPSFQISATINPNRRVRVLLGKADGSEPKHSVTFLLPESIDGRAANVLKVQFAGWFVSVAWLNDTPLSTDPPARTH